MWKYIKFGIFLIASNLPLLVTAFETVSIASTLVCNDGTRTNSQWTLYKDDDIVHARLHSPYNRDLPVSDRCTYAYDEVRFSNDYLPDYDTHHSVSFNDGSSGLMRVYRRMNGFTGVNIIPSQSSSDRSIKAGTMLSWIVN